MRPIESVKGELLACTFCAFCRRSCPVYRATLWEGESPRGRVAQGYGLLMDELEPTDEFYDSIGFSIVSRAQYRKSLIDYFEIIKSGCRLTWCLDIMKKRRA